MTTGNLMKVDSIAECSILIIFCIITYYNIIETHACKPVPFCIPVLKVLEPAFVRNLFQKSLNIAFNLNTKQQKIDVGGAYYCQLIDSIIQRRLSC